MSNQDYKYLEIPVPPEDWYKYLEWIEQQKEEEEKLDSSGSVIIVDV